MIDFVRELWRFVVAFGIFVSGMYVFLELLVWIGVLEHKDPK